MSKDRVILEALEVLKAKAIAKAQHKPFNRQHDPILCPCDTCRANYKPMQLHQRHFVIDSTYRNNFEDDWRDR